ncbi:RGS domain-containing protein [Sporodiniella umbellata]|nr:RGS domain-containing protein [Sporodiniella umbellata]
MSKVRRASIPLNDLSLSTRTRNTISKSRRSSLVEEKVPSRRGSLAAVLNALSSQTIEEPLVDVQKLYKKRVNKSFKKLNHFFGETTPVDVCISEIRKEGLKAVLESKVPLCYFLNYLLEEYSSENLFFYLKVQQFENSVSTSLETAQEIYNAFISDDADLEINLDDKVKQRITHQLAEGRFELTIFQTAKTSVYSLLETSYVRFLGTQTHQDMVSQCGELTTLYSENATRQAISYLFNYLKQHRSVKKNRALNQDMADIGSRHYELIKHVIERFVEDIFGKSYLPSKKMF